MVLLHIKWNPVYTDTKETYHSVHFIRVSVLSELSENWSRTHVAVKRKKGKNSNCRDKTSSNGYSTRVGQTQGKKDGPIKPNMLRYFVTVFST